MSERMQLLKEMAETFFGRTDRALQGLSAKEIEWRPVEESNNIRWILTHISQELNILLPRMIKGDAKYAPEGWSDDYSSSNPTLERLLVDIAAGKKAVLDGIANLTETDLDEEIDLGRGPRKRRAMILMYLSEIVHHEGQIAALRGIIARRRQKDPTFLT